MQCLFCLIGIELSSHHFLSHKTSSFCALLSYTQHISCHTAYHVTCGFQHNLLMQTKLDTSNTGSVIHEVYSIYSPVSIPLVLCVHVEGVDLCVCKSVMLALYKLLRH